MQSYNFFRHFSFVCPIDAFSDGRLVIAITKFDSNYTDRSLGYGSESDSEEEEYSASFFNKPHYFKVEEKAKHTLHEFIQDATQLAVSPDIILPVCGEWALCGTKLSSYLQSHSDRLDSKRFGSRFREATNALNKHPKRVELGIPGAQGQSELESIQALEPNTVVRYLNQVTGIEVLKHRCIS